MLVLGTPLEIYLLAVTFENGDNLVLHSTKFSVTTDNITVTKIVSTNEGRIFMSGNDGNVYELHYRSGPTFFSNRCWKENLTSSKWNQLVPGFLKWNNIDPIVSMAVDNERKLLYTLTESSSIECYSLGYEGNSFEKSSSISFETIRNTLHRASVNYSDTLKLISINPTRISESDSIHLVAVSSNGIRAYFSSFPHRRMLDVVHFRFLDQSQASQKSIQIDLEASYYSQGVLLLSTKEKNNRMMATSPAYSLDSFSPRFDHFVEKMSVLNIQDIKYFNEYNLTLVSNTPASLFTDHYSRNEMADQFLLPPRLFLGVTNMGIYKFIKIRPVDTLRDLIEQSKGTDTPSLKGYFKSMGLDQSCSMCLYLICCDETSSTFGSPLKGKSSWRNESVASWASQAFFRYGIKKEEHPGLGFPSYSGCHNGFILFLARILRFIWSRRMFRNVDDIYYSSLTLEQITLLKKILTRLDAFLKANPLFSSLEQNIVHHRRKVKVDTSKEEETKSVVNHWEIVKRALEVMSLLEILITEGPREVSTEFTPRSELERLYFSDLIALTDMELIRELIYWIILSKNQTNSHFAVEEITSRLERNCKTFFSVQDRKRTIANELIQKALVTDNITDRLNFLNESLTLYKEIAGALVLTLPDICLQYFNLRYYTGIVELVLSCAYAIDPNNLAIRALREGVPEEGKQLIGVRNKCYSEVSAVLTKLHNFDEEINPQELINARREVITMALNSRDELFHYNLYAWYIDNGITNELISIKTPYLEDYLKFFCRTNNNQLLWRYYLNNNRFGDAADILVRMALEEPDAMLEERFDFLTKALNLAQADETISHDMVNEIRDRVDLARIQLRIKARLLLENLNVSALDSQLFDLSDLYNQYTQKYHLYEESLMLLQYGSFDDLSLPRLLWSNIIDRECRICKECNSIQPLLSKMRELVQQFSGSMNVFPYDDLIERLESASYELKVPDYQKEQIVDLFIDRIPYSMLINVYDRLYETQLIGRKERVIITVSQIIYILESWKKSTESYREFDGIQSKYFDSIINKYMRRLEGENLDKRIREDLITRLKVLSDA